GYLGCKGAFDRAFGEFATRYADRAAPDHRELLDAGGAGRIEARSDVRAQPSSPRSIAVWVCVATCVPDSLHRSATPAASPWPPRVHHESMTTQVPRIGASTCTSSWSDALPTGRSPPPSATTRAEPSASPGIGSSAGFQSVPSGAGGSVNRNHNAWRGSDSPAVVVPAAAPAPLATCHSVLSRKPSGNSLSKARSGGSTGASPSSAGRGSGASRRPGNVGSVNTAFTATLT